MIAPTVGALSTKPLYGQSSPGKAKALRRSNTYGGLRGPGIHYSDSEENMKFILNRIHRVQQTEDHKPALTRKNRYMRPLAEAVILQASADLWSRLYRKESLEFFQGKGFSLYASIAGMSPYEKEILLGLMRSPLTGKRLNNSQQ